MTQQPGQTPAHSRGAVDLTSLSSGTGAPGPGAQNPSAGSASGASWVVYDADQNSLQQVLQYAAQVPVIIHLATPSDPSSAQIDQVLIPEIDSRAGRMVMARLDAEAHPELLQLFGGTTPPMVLAVIGGQAMPLLNAPAPADQIKAVLDEINSVAVQSGLSATVPPLVQAQPEAEGELPPLLQKAEDALVAGDFDAAKSAYDQALSENPQDEVAKSGKARVELIERTATLDLQQARETAAQNPDDVQAQIQVADLDVLGGHVEDAFQRLVTYISTHFGDDREAARVHLIELYKVLGDQDERVNASRKKLAMALF